MTVAPRHGQVIDHLKRFPIAYRGKTTSPSQRAIARRLARALMRFLTPMNLLPPAAGTRDHIVLIQRGPFLSAELRNHRGDPTTLPETPLSRVAFFRRFFDSLFRSCAKISLTDQWVAPRLAICKMWNTSRGCRQFPFSHCP